MAIEYAKEMFVLELDAGGAESEPIERKYDSVVIIQVKGCALIKNEAGRIIDAINQYSAVRLNSQNGFRFILSTDKDHTKPFKAIVMHVELPGEG